MCRDSIVERLTLMGTPKKLKGYEYIIDTLELMDETNIYVWMQLYQSVADKHHCSMKSVERALRFALDSTRNRLDNYEIIDDFIGYDICNTSTSLTKLYRQIKQDTKDNYITIKE